MLKCRHDSDAFSDWETYLSGAWPQPVEELSGCTADLFGGTWQRNTGLFFVCFLIIISKSAGRDLVVFWKHRVFPILGENSDLY